MAAPTVTYRDLDLTFLPHATTGDVSQLTDVAAVRRSIKTLIMTPYNTRPFQPTLGSSVGNLLFELSDTVTERMLVEEINRTISTFEPRAQVMEILVSQPDPLSYTISIVVLVNLDPNPVVITMNVNPSESLVRIR